MLIENKGFIEKRYRKLWMRVGKEKEENNT